MLNNLSDPYTSQLGSPEAASITLWYASQLPQGILDLFRSLSFIGSGWLKLCLHGFPWYWEQGHMYTLPKNQDRETELSQSKVTLKVVLWPSCAFKKNNHRTPFYMLFLYLPSREERWFWNTLENSRTPDWCLLCWPLTRGGSSCSHSSHSAPSGGILRNTCKVHSAEEQL